MTPHPLGGEVSNPQSLNRYAYVLNNPTTFVDPLGLTEQVLPGCDPSDPEACGPPPCNPFTDIECNPGCSIGNPNCTPGCGALGIGFPCGPIGPPGGIRVGGGGSPSGAGTASTAPPLADTVGNASFPMGSNVCAIWIPTDAWPPQVVVWGCGQSLFWPAIGTAVAVGAGVVAWLNPFGSASGPALPEWGRLPGDIAGCEASTLAEDFGTGAGELIPYFSVFSYLPSSPYFLGAWGSLLETATIKGGVLQAVKAIPGAAEVVPAVEQGSFVVGGLLTGAASLMDLSARVKCY